MMPQTGYQTIAKNILCNISRNKGNQRMKYGQVLEYNMRNIFHKKCYIKCVGKTIPRSFSKNQN